MPLMFLVVLAAAHLENFHLVVPAVGDHRRRYRGTCYQRLAYLDGITLTDHQYLIDNDLRANVCRYLFYFKFFAGRDAVLLAAGFYDRIHWELLKVYHWKNSSSCQTEPTIIHKPMEPVKTKTMTYQHAPALRARVDSAASGYLLCRSFHYL